LLVYHCCVCSKRVTGSPWVCGKCATTHGLTGPVSGWPAWAKALKQSESRERRYMRLGIGDPQNMVGPPNYNTDYESWPKNPYSEQPNPRMVDAGYDYDVACYGEP
jgi:hypothetical protein